MENTMEKPYTLKKLGSENLFTFCTILSKIGFKEIKQIIEPEKIKALVANETEGNEINIEKVGFDIAIDIATIIVANMENCKDSIYKSLSDLSGMTKQELAALDIGIFVEMIFDVFHKEEFKDFFKVVSKLFK
jgi:hypothetical protein